MQEACEILTEHMRDARFIVYMRLLHPRQIPVEPVFALPFLNGVLHSSHIGGELKAFTVSKPYVVVWFAFHESNAFGFKTCSEIRESLCEELWKKKQ